MSAVREVTCVFITVKILPDHTFVTVTMATGLIVMDTPVTVSAMVLDSKRTMYTSLIIILVAQQI